MFLNFFLVALGSTVGGCARYGLSLIINAHWRDAFPFSTFIINVLGSFIIGALAAWLSDAAPNSSEHDYKLLLMVGLCGGFTTFSSFSLETLNLLRSGQATTALGYITASVVVCVVATAIGYSLIKH